MDYELEAIGLVQDAFASGHVEIEKALRAAFSAGWKAGRAAVLEAITYETDDGAIINSYVEDADLREYLPTEEPA